MKTFEISYVIDGKYFKEVVTATNSHKAREIVRMRYDGAKIMAVKEI